MFAHIYLGIITSLINVVYCVLLFVIGHVCLIDSVCCCLGVVIKLFLVKSNFLIQCRSFVQNAVNVSNPSVLLNVYLFKACW
ncbi:hypothetical protein LACWKB10_1960 [Lactobacillus sp. wkB10]|nr:hypothetical protein LACWKB10_1960 [Lactobacillus sp. wkB10]